MPTKLSHLLYRLVGRDPPDPWVDRSMMQQHLRGHRQEHRSWKQSIFQPNSSGGGGGGGGGEGGGGGGGGANAGGNPRGRSQSVGAATTIINNASTTTITPRGGGSATKTALPAKIKIRAENERQLEVKIGKSFFFSFEKI